MARTDNLTNFCMDIADSIRTVTGKTEPISASEFDTEIASIPSISSLELMDGSYLFYNNARVNISQELLSMQKKFINTYYMFYGASNITTPINWVNGELDNLTSASAYTKMFYGASQIPSIKLSSVSTIPTSMEAMFYNCKAATTIDISELPADSVTSMASTFEECSALKNANISGLNTAKVKSLKYFLRNCSNLEELPTGFTELNVANVTEGAYLLSGCSSLQNIDLSTMAFNKLTTFEYMFYDCSGAKHIKLPTAGTSMKTLSGIFYGCDSLESIDWNGLNTSIVTSISSMFGSASTDTTIEGKMDLDLSSIPVYTSLSFNSLFKGNKCCRSVVLPDLSNVTINTGTGFVSMFENATSLVSVSIPVIKSTSKVTSLARMFSGCIRLKSVTGLENIMNAGTTLTPGYGTNQGLYRMFYGCESLESIDLSGIDTTNITQGNPSSAYSTCGLFEMFRGCKSLKTLDISHFVINSTISYIYNMFYDCESLETVALPDFSTSSATNANSMFANCKSLNEITGYPIPWTKFTTFTRMFAGCGLKTFTIDTNLINNRGSIYLTEMFRGCERLKEVDMSAMGYLCNDRYSEAKHMFADCPNLETVDISNFWHNGGYYSGTPLTGMFKNCTSLKNVKLHHVSSEPFVGTNSYVYGVPSMFENCTSLEVLDLRYFYPNCTQMGYGSRFLANCRKLRKLDVRGGGFGELGPGSSAWDNANQIDTLLNVGVDNDSPTIVYVDNGAKRNNWIALGNKFGLGWSTANVLVVSDPEEEVDMT